MAAYFAALDPMTLVRALPGNVAQGIIWGIMALGVYITFRILDFADLTVDGSLATGGAVAVMLIRAGMNPAQIGLYSVNLGIMGKSNQAVNVMQYKLVASLRYVTGEGNWIFFLKLIFAALILIALCYWFFGTELGASIRATGCNEQMARAQGINTGFNKVLALMISNGLVGLCGGIYAQYQGAADVNMGRGAIVIGLAAVIISEVIFGKFCAHRKAAFAFTLGAVFIGAILYYLVIALVLWLKMPSDYMKLFSAVVVACFLAVPYMKDTYFKKGRAK
jgi:putative ABC transport system permease protein